MNIQTLSDTELADLLDRCRDEYQRRQTITSALRDAPELAVAYLESVGRSMGEPYQPPTSYLDAYPKDWEVLHDNKLWVALRDGATGIPGESPDWQQVATEGEILPWEQRYAGNEYRAGDKVVHNGHVWEAERVTAHEPGVPHSGWVDLGPTQEGEPA